MQCIRFTVISDTNQDPIEGLNLVIDKTHHALNKQVIITVAMERGSHVTYRVDFADGSSTTTENPEKLAFKNPVTVSHSYSIPGNYTVGVTASNGISNKFASKMITVQEKLETINLQYDTIVGFPPGSVDFELSLNSQFHLSSINVDWLFGNGKSSHEYIEVLANNGVHQKQYQYFINDIGPMEFSVNVSNAVSSIVHKGFFTLQQIIRDVKVEIVSDEVLSTGQTFFTLVSVTKGTDLNVHIQIGDGNEYNDFKSNYDNVKEGKIQTLNVSHSYDTPGHYFIHVKVYNNISEQMYNHSRPINVQQFVKGLTVETFGIVGTPGDVAKFRVKYEGPEDEYPTEVTCTLHINNVFSSKATVDSFKETTHKDIDFILTDIYNTGNLPVKLNCSNNLNYQLLNTSLQIQRKVGSVIVLPNKVNIAVNDTVVFDIVISAGEDITMSVNYGDGSEEDVISIPGLFNSDKVFQFIHTYRLPGFFIPTVLIVNLVSRILRSLETNVFEAITGVELKRYYRLSDINTERSFGEGENENIFPKERDVIFETTYKTGNGLSFFWDFGDNKQLTSKEKDVSHRYVHDGNFSISLNISNAIFSVIKHVKIEIYETVQMYLLENNGPKKALEVMSFQLFIGRPGTFSCYSWDMGDNTEPHIYGGSSCRQYANSSEKYTEWNPVSSQETTMVHSHVYKSEENFAVKITGFNLISTATQESTAVVAGINCYYPEVNIKGLGQNPDHPVEYFRSDRIPFESVIVVNCPASSEAAAAWTLQKVLPGQSYHDIVLEDFPLGEIALNNFQVNFNTL